MVIYTKNGNYFDTVTAAIFIAEDPRQDEIYPDYNPKRVQLGGIYGRRVCRPGTMFDKPYRPNMKPLEEKTIRAMDWAAKGRKPNTDIVYNPWNPDKERQERREREIEYLRKHGGLNTYFDQEASQGREARRTGNIEAAKGFYSRILKRIHKAGYKVEEYDDNWPTPRFRILDPKTCDWFDNGPLAKNKGVFTLVELGNLFGDPSCCDDPIRCYHDPATGEVVGKTADKDIICNYDEYVKRY